MTAARIQLLTFDLDDTLWEFAPVLVRAEQITYAWLQQHAPALTARFSVEALRTRRFELARRQPELAHRISSLRLISLREALQAAGLDDNSAEQLSRSAFDVFLEARHGVAFFDGTERVLTELGRDYRLGAITNGNVEVARLGLDRHFAVAINAERLARAKPHPEPFLAALEQAGCGAAASIHIGDHIDHDIRGAQAVGMHTIWMNRTGEPWPEGPPPSAEIRHLTELPAAVRRVVAGLSG